LAVGAPLIRITSTVHHLLDLTKSQVCVLNLEVEILICLKMSLFIFKIHHPSLLSFVVDNEQIQAYRPNDHFDHSETSKI